MIREPITDVKYILKNNIKATAYTIYNTMSLPYRHNFRWNINELLSLQREYELLEMTIQDIAAKHERTVDAILYRLQQEGYIETWIDARGYQEYSKNFDYIVGSLDSGVNAYDYGEDVVEDDVNENDSDYQESECDDEGDEVEDDVSTLSQRVWGLETAVNDIKGMIGTLLSRFSSPSKPLKKLRQTNSQPSAEI
jgi:hypothetical protein